MRPAILALLLFIPQDDPVAVVRKALEKTEAASYSYIVSGRFDRTGEFVPPAILTSRIGSLEAARNGLMEDVFAGIPKGGSLRTVDQLKRLYGQIAAEIRDLCTKTMGEMAASGLVEAAYEEASEGKEELVRRFRLNKPLGVA